jgi:hypothetical protein
MKVAAAVGPRTRKRDAGFVDDSFSAVTKILIVNLV